MRNVLTPYLDLAMTLGEGPVWDAEAMRLYWVDIVGGALHWLDWDSGDHHSADQGEAITCVVPRSGGGLLAARRSGLWHLHADGGAIAQLEAAPYDTADHRFNDGGCDPVGRFWIGSMDESRHNADAALYRYDGRGLGEVLGGMTITNGLAFSTDGRWMYHTDTPTRVIRRHAFDADSGGIGPGQTWIDLNTLDIDGFPDGAAVDVDDCYWVALFGGAAVARFDADGRLMARYELSALQPTMPVFAGPDRRTLFVTTARENMSAEQLERWPHSGALFSMHADSAGRPLARFADPA